MSTKVGRPHVEEGLNAAVGPSLRLQGRDRGFFGRDRGLFVVGQLAGHLGIADGQRLLELTGEVNLDLGPPFRVLPDRYQHVGSNRGRKITRFFLENPLPDDRSEGLDLRLVLVDSTIQWSVVNVDFLLRLCRDIRQ